MAKKEKMQKYFDCNTCSEKLEYLGVGICTLRIKELDEYQLPNYSSLIENIKSCDFYRQIKQK